MTDDLTLTAQHGEGLQPRIALVVPPLIHAGVAFTSVAGPEHIGVAYLAASLRRNGFEVKIFNFDLETYLRVMTGEGFVESQPPVEEMASEVLEFRPGFLGISATGPTLEVSLALAAKIRERRPDLHISFGGHQATAAAADLMREEGNIDSIGLGDCDFTLVEAARRVCRGEDLEGMWGFLYRREDGSIGGGWPPNTRPGTLVQLGRSDAEDGDGLYALASLPHPARDDLITIQRRAGVREARMSTSRGCMDFCTFCATSTTSGFRSHTLRPADDVLAEMEELKHTYGIEHFWFVDDNYVSRDPVSQDRAVEIAHKLLERQLGVTMRAYFRADAFDGRPDLLPLLFESGVVTGLIGIESATPRRLQYFGKRCSPQQMRDAVAKVREVGMGLQVGFIFYDPLTSFPDMLADAEFLLEVGEAYILFNFVQNMDVYPGTAFRRLLEKKGLSTAEHAYRGGFRQYVYEDRRIAPLAALMDRLYEKPLVATDRALMRLRAYKVPRLRWLALLDMLPPAARQQTQALYTETEELCRQLGQAHHRWALESIERAEKEVDKEAIERSLARTLAAREPLLDRLEELSRQADDVAAEHPYSPAAAALWNQGEGRLAKCSSR